MYTLFMLKASGTISLNNSSFNPKRFCISDVALFCNNKRNPNYFKLFFILEMKDGNIKKCSSIPDRLRNTITWSQYRVKLRPVSSQLGSSESKLKGTLILRRKAVSTSCKVPSCFQLGKLFLFYLVLALLSWPWAGILACKNITVSVFGIISQAFFTYATVYKEQQIISWGWNISYKVQKCKAKKWHFFHNCWRN